MIIYILFLYGLHLLKAFIELINTSVKSDIIPIKKITELIYYLSYMIAYICLFEILTK